MQPPAGNHVCRDGRREAEKRSRVREGETEQPQTGWLLRGCTFKLELFWKRAKEETNSFKAWTA